MALYLVHNARDHHRKAQENLGERGLTSGEIQLERNRIQEGKQKSGIWGSQGGCRHEVLTVWGPD